MERYLFPKQLKYLQLHYLRVGVLTHLKFVNIYYIHRTDSYSFFFLSLSLSELSILQMVKHGGLKQSRVECVCVWYIHVCLFVCPNVFKCNSSSTHGCQVALKESQFSHFNFSLLQSLHDNCNVLFLFMKLTAIRLMIIHILAHI
jgi:hypothetical protein